MIKQIQKKINKYIVVLIKFLYNIFSKLREFFSIITAFLVYLLFFPINILYLLKKIIFIPFIKKDNLTISHYLYLEIDKLNIQEFIKMCLSLPILILDSLHLSIIHKYIFLRNLFLFSLSLYLIIFNLIIYIFDDSLNYIQLLNNENLYIFLNYFNFNLFNNYCVLEGCLNNNSIGFLSNNINIPTVLFSTVEDVSSDSENENENEEPLFRSLSVINKNDSKYYNKVIFNLKVENLLDLDYLDPANLDRHNLFDPLAVEQTKPTVTLSNESIEGIPFSHYLLNKYKNIHRNNEITYFGPLLTLVNSLDNNSFLCFYYENNGEWRIETTGHLMQEDIIKVKIQLSKQGEPLFCMTYDGEIIKELSFMRQPHRLSNEALSLLVKQIEHKKVLIY